MPHHKISNLPFPILAKFENHTPKKKKEIIIIKNKKKKSSPLKSVIPRSEWVTLPDSG